MSYIDYQKKFVTLTKAAEAVQSGDVIWIGSTLSIPITFLDRLAARADALKNVTLIGSMFVRSHVLFTDLRYQDSFKVISIVGRQMMPKAMANVQFIYNAGGSVIENICMKYGINALAVEVCPTDTNGICGFGAFGTHMTSYVNSYEGINKRIVIINDFQPEGGKDERDFVDLSSCDFIAISHHKLFSTDEHDAPQP